MVVREEERQNPPPAPPSGRGDRATSVSECLVCRCNLKVEPTPGPSRREGRKNAERGPRKNLPEEGGMLEPEAVWN